MRGWWGERVEGWQGVDDNINEKVVAVVDRVNKDDAVGKVMEWLWQNWSQFNPIWRCIKIVTQAYVIEAVSKHVYILAYAYHCMCDEALYRGSTAQNEWCKPALSATYHVCSTWSGSMQHSSYICISWCHSRVCTAMYVCMYIVLYNITSFFKQYYYSACVKLIL